MSTDPIRRFEAFLKEHPERTGKVVDFNPATDCLINFDFTESNTELDAATIADTSLFSAWVDQKLEKSGCRYGIGGYDEHRTIYARSNLFDTVEEPRRLHLGVDIWGPAGTKVYNPIDATVHSFKFNDNFGDYGATIILEHDLDGLKLYSLYGHLNLASLDYLAEGQFIPKGQAFAEFGIPEENGHWPPHLHFQLMFNLGDFKGDYPGVCCFSQKDSYLNNCPDPNQLLKYTFG